MFILDIAERGRYSKMSHDHISFKNLRYDIVLMKIINFRIFLFVKAVSKQNSLERCVISDSSYFKCRLPVFIVCIQNAHVKIFPHDSCIVPLNLYKIHFQIQYLAAVTSYVVLHKRTDKAVSRWPPDFYIHL